MARRDQARISETYLDTADVIVRLTECSSGDVTFEKQVPIYMLNATRAVAWQVAREKKYEVVE